MMNKIILNNYAKYIKMHEQKIFHYYRRRNIVAISYSHLREDYLDDFFLFIHYYYDKTICTSFPYKFNRIDEIITEVCTLYSKKRIE